MILSPAKLLASAKLAVSNISKQNTATKYHNYFQKNLKTMANAKTTKHVRAGVVASISIASVDVQVGTSIININQVNPTDGGAYTLPNAPVIRSITMDDINQGQIGDCYFLTCLELLAGYYPTYITDNLLMPDVDAKGNIIPGRWVGVFYRNGTITRVHGDCQIANIQNRSGSDGDFWAALLEKFYALFREGLDTFGSLNNGWMSDVFNDFNIPSDDFFSGILPPTLKADWSNIIPVLLAAMKAGAMVSVGSLPNGPAGMPQDHAEGFLPWYMQPERYSPTPQFLRMRNPWGNQGGQLYVDVATSDFIQYFKLWLNLCPGPAGYAPPKTCGFDDLIAVAQNFGKVITPPGTYPDLTKQGKIDFATLLYVAQNFAGVMPPVTSNPDGTLSVSPPPAPTPVATVVTTKAA